MIKLKKQISHKNNFKMKLKKNYQKNSKHKKEIKILLQQKIFCEVVIVKTIFNNKICKG
jgi:hypothetical protein